MTSSPNRSATWLVAIAGAATLASAAGAQDAPAAARTTFNFEYDRADLTSPERARKLLHSLSLRAREACEIRGVAALHFPTARRDCEADLVAKVVAGIDSPFLTAAFTRPPESLPVRSPEPERVLAAAAVGE